MGFVPDNVNYKCHPTNHPRVVHPVVCDRCGRTVMIWFGSERCGCTPPGSHLDEMLERVTREGR